jgi:hypothetical protein
VRPLLQQLLLLRLLMAEMSRRALRWRAAPRSLLSVGPAAAPAAMTRGATSPTCMAGKHNTLKSNSIV